MHVKALKLVNFKRFRNEYLEFNDDVNILVGDNNADQAVRNYSRGYYYDAKAKGLLEEVGLR